MARITLYIDDATLVLLVQAAQANKVSKSRWVTEIIGAYTANEWPQECLHLAGRFNDFPLRELKTASLPVDQARIAF